MEKSRQTKTRTIQMKYPTQYSQSWSNPVPVHSPEERNNKSYNKINTDPNVHQHSQRISDKTNRKPRKISTHAPKPKGNIQKLAPELFGSWLQQPRVRVRGPDTNAPHLKYGVFPQRKTAFRAQTKTIAMKSSLGIQLPPNEIGKKEPKKTAKKGTLEQLADAPLLVFRPIDKRNSRQLTKSETAHLDIRPRRNLP